MLSANAISRIWLEKPAASALSVLSACSYALSVAVIASVVFVTCRISKEHFSRLRAAYWSFLNQCCNLEVGMVEIDRRQKCVGG